VVNNDCYTTMGCSPRPQQTASDADPLLDSKIETENRRLLRMRIVQLTTLKGPRPRLSGLRGMKVNPSRRVNGTVACLVPSPSSRLAATADTDTHTHTHTHGHR